MEVLQDDKSLGDLGVQGVGGVEELEKLVVLHLEQHTGDLTSELRLSAKKEETSDEYHGTREEKKRQKTYGAIFT